MGLRSGKSKHKQYNGQWSKEKGRKKKIIFKTLHRKLMIE